MRLCPSQNPEWPPLDNTGCSQAKPLTTKQGKGTSNYGHTLEWAQGPGPVPPNTYQSGIPSRGGSTVDAFFPEDSTRLTIQHSPRAAWRPWEARTEQGQRAGRGTEGGETEGGMWCGPHLSRRAGGSVRRLPEADRRPGPLLSRDLRSHAISSLRTTRGDAIPRQGYRL